MQKSLSCSDHLSPPFPIGQHLSSGGSHAQDVIDSQNVRNLKEDITIATVVVGWGIGLPNALKGRILVSLNQIDLQVLELRDICWS